MIFLEVVIGLGVRCYQLHHSGKVPWKMLIVKVMRLM
jgi:hypothetical protein